MKPYSPVLLVRIFALGWRESDGDMGMTYDHPETLRSRAYDSGRNWGRIFAGLAGARRAAIVAWSERAL